MAKVFNPLKINDLIVELQITKKEFCKSMDTGYTTTVHWLKTPSTMRVDDLVRMCNMYNKDISYFIYDPDVKEEVEKDSKDVNIVLVKMAQELVEITKRYEQEIGQLKIDNFKEISKKDAEIHRLRLALAGDQLSNGGIYGDKAADNEPLKYGK